MRLVIWILMACGLLQSADIEVVVGSPVVAGKTATLTVVFTSSTVVVESVAWTIEVVTASAVSFAVTAGPTSKVVVTKAYKGRKTVTFSLPAISAVDGNGKPLTVGGIGQERQFRL